MARRTRNRKSDSGELSTQMKTWQQPVNRFGPISIISEDEVERLHEASMQILETTGLEVFSAQALALYAGAGADVNHATQRVRMDRDLVKDLVTKAPETFTLHARNPERNLTVGGKHLIFTPATTPPYCSDLERGRRPGSFSDFKELVRLGHSLETMHCFSGYPVEPQDLPVPTRHLDSFEAFITFTDKVWRPYVSAPGSIQDGLEMIAIARGISKEQLANEPSLLTNTNLNSPLRFDDVLADGMIEMARMGQACVVSSFTLAGAMAPITLAGTLAQQNAEVLGGICLAQIVRPGAPVVYGSFTSNVDMKSGSPALGTPEYMKSAIISGQLARRYGLPYRTSSCCSANVVDEQAVYETQMSIWGALLGGVNMMFHGHGWLESGLTTSYEKFILDADMLQMAIEAMEPLDFSDDNLALSTIDDVGPGGHFFGTQHTMDRYRTAFYTPMLSDWRNFESWQEAGSKRAAERATPIWKKLLENYEEPPLDRGIKEEIGAFVARRREEITRYAKAS